ncbi:SGNH/GDSL hydrolase family protein [Pediococcus claussenii]|uniref:GDSL-like Lipase/Acylhydrolase family protein n=1 Tax=Pediococcus claussenii (strain ATCC BAA-344 / DSM 14800 / JCM 18046 / KCTC 3811 / LMG 21948 / P06) TaxID=701521 RepID=G8PAK6_PEDCP|nr:SGNH/GDSL hydrolase family protein [Pediococcus claussenii]AEV95795.1 GDSL-like Lipase/Acylhydrolase family protein [Pediococcus claussenii ATCC BAA-344]ANZ69295.1 lysophospholipase [Pediococcus claussenii]ANZ71115.1 lysophospholipase [Pediococcus claussenii]KRN20403.1 hypothetical protein IV79_GL000458 [Pediococcus claussenii]
MKDESKKLTRLDPKIKNFQEGLLKKYREANQKAQKGQIVFVGSSLMEIFPIEKMQEEHDLKLGKIIYNRGIRATTTKYLLENMNTQILDLKPSKVFINIGSNDIGFHVPEEEFLGNYDQILKRIKRELPDTEVFVMAFYPVNDKAVTAIDDRSNRALEEASSKIKQLTLKNGYQYINVNQGLTDKNGLLRDDLTFDGTHMYPKGYEIVLKNMMKYLK